MVSEKLISIEKATKSKATISLFVSIDSERA
jgi:hypothetical protein